MDNETKKELTYQQKIKELVNHEGWLLVRDKLTTKILDLQNAFNVEVSTPEAMFIDLKARMLSSTILFDFLREVEGTAQQADEVKKPFEKSYIVKD